ncbi:PH domain-containing protein [Flavobacterium bizetiae]|uniref:PH domain-containing protein n=1 Tax=Flavobacterium bizetiae TaxID=2704140 RepID=UPI0021E745FB|nr:PH domain-containing protein [Flavobacterium bizetiae]UTN06291.1 PH domain-containing protein [Flavobacterium bizetiae]
MANCILCSTELKFMNTPTFGSGKLNDSSIVCTSCFKKINNVNPKVAFKLKNYSLNDIQNLLNEKISKNEYGNSRLDEIKEQILKLTNGSIYLGKREINELPEILARTEVIDNIAQGTYNNGQGILISTNRRLIFIDKGILYGLKVEDFPLDKITSIQYETGLLLGGIKIYTSGNIAKIENVEKSIARSFAEFVRDKLSQDKEVGKNIISEPNILDQLEKLAKLRENAILSEDEFNEQKKKLLEKL